MSRAESNQTTATLRIAVLLTCDVPPAEDVYQEMLQRLAARRSRVDTPKGLLPAGHAQHHGRP